MTQLQIKIKILLIISMIVLLTLDQMLRTKLIKKTPGVNTTSFLRNLATSTFSFQLVTENVIYQVIKCFNSKKTVVDLMESAVN